MVLVATNFNNQAIYAFSLTADYSVQIKEMFQMTSEEEMKEKMQTASWEEKKKILGRTVVTWGVVFRYSLKTKEWRDAPSLNQARTFLSSCTLGQKIYVFGGKKVVEKLLLKDLGRF